MRTGLYSGLPVLIVDDWRVRSLGLNRPWDSALSALLSPHAALVLTRCAHSAVASRDWIAQALSADFLERRYAEIASRFAGGWDRRTLFAESWVERVRSTLEAGTLPVGVCAVR